MQASVSQYLSLPQNPGIYIFLDNKNNVVYIGKAKNLKNRVSSYFTSSDLGEKTKKLVSQVHKIKFVSTESEIESLLLESSYIKKYKPHYNIKLMDDKSYPYILITKEKYPKIYLVRKFREEIQKSTYFGPYPSVKETKLVLKTIRKIFPFQSFKHTKRVCLYYHLKLCICPSIIEKDNRQKEYKSNIRHVAQFLNGRSKLIIKELEKERDKKSDQEAFEKASEIQKKIDAVKLVTSPIFKPFEYHTNPNLRFDLRQKELSLLEDILKKNGVIVDSLKRIECYDISNISGAFATGSMVVLTNGEIDKKAYRRFRIKFTQTNKPNDFEMMREVFRRRLNHTTDWQLPNLFIVDGGKGQISSAKEVLLTNNCQVPVVGLSKREETIITSDFVEISLPKDNVALQIVQRIRDEAHRFAVSYHRKLRSKILNN